MKKLAVAFLVLLLIVAVMAQGCGLPRPDPGFSLVDDGDDDTHAARMRRQASKGDRDHHHKKPAHSPESHLPLENEEDQFEDEDFAPTTELPEWYENSTGLYDEDGNCTICQIREEQKKMRIELIKDDILRKLRLDAPPNISVTPEEYPKIPFLNESQLAELMKTPQPVEEEENEVTRVITFASAPPEEQWECLNQVGTRPQDVIFFEFDRSETHASRINQAYLYLFLKEHRNRPTRSLPQHTKIQLYRVMRDMHGQLTWGDRPDISQKVNLRNANTDGWLTFHVKNIAADWIRRPNENFGFLVKASRGRIQDMIVLGDSWDQPDFKYYKPFVTIVLGKSTRRQRRTASSRYQSCQEGSKEWRCCRYPLVVDFDAFGWDWVVQPRRYMASYCSGKCTFAVNTNSAHAHILSLAKKDEGIGPCCTPVKMSPISMVYFTDDGGLVYRILDDMIVDRCGCN